MSSETHCNHDHETSELWLRGALRSEAQCGNALNILNMEIPRAEFTAPLEYAKHWLTFNVEGDETSKTKLHVAQRSLTWFFSHQRQNEHATGGLKTRRNQDSYMSCEVSQWAFSVGTFLRNDALIQHISSRNAFLSQLRSIHAKYYIRVYFMSQQNIWSSSVIDILLFKHSICVIQLDN